MKEKLVNNISLGCDPEIFLYSEQRLKYIPVCGLVGGTKDSPIFFTEKGHALQEDNVTLEFCQPPSKSLEEWLENINFVKDYITETILKPLELIPHYIASARFDEEDLNSDQAQHMGCDPSYNVYTLEENKVDRSDLTLRTSSGHIHIGYDNPNVDTNILLVKAFDLFLGVTSILLDPDKERRKMYGKSGEFRMKAYGVECRVLSSFWLENDILITWVYEQTMKAIDFVNQGGIITNEQDIIKCINTYNIDLAKEILEDYNIEVLNYEKT